MKAESVCPLILPVVPTGLIFLEESVFLACPQTVGNSMVGKSGTVVPLLPSAASAPWRPSHAGAGDASHSVIPPTVKEGAHHPLMWEM